MAYSKTTWQNGDVITAPKLNKMEQGIFTNYNAIESLEQGSLSAVGASVGDIPIADGNGNWNWLTNGFVTPQMYGAVGDGVTDDTQAIQMAVNSGKKVVFPYTNNPYIVSSPIIIDAESVIIEGMKRENPYYSTTVKIKMKSENLQDAVFKLTKNANYFSCANITIDCNSKASDGISFVATDSNFIHDVVLEKMSVINALSVCYRFEGIYKSTFSNTRALNGEYGYLITGNPVNGWAGTSMTLIECYSDYASNAGFRLKAMVYSSILTCAVDHTNIAYSIKDCRSLTINGCGCEQIKTPLFFDETNNEGITINSFYASNITGTTSYDAVIYCNQVLSMTISGIITDNNSRTYDIYTNIASTKITVLDRSINPTKCHSANDSITFLAYMVAYANESTPQIAGMFSFKDNNPKVAVNNGGTLEWRGLPQVLYSGTVSAQTKKFNLPEGRAFMLVYITNANNYAPAFVFGASYSLSIATVKDLLASQYCTVTLSGTELTVTTTSGGSLAVMLL